MGFSYTLRNLHCIKYKQSFETLIEAFCYNWQKLKILAYVSKTWKNSLVHSKESKLHLSQWEVHLHVMEKVFIILTPPLLQDLSIITTDLMILRAFSNLNDSMILSHVRTCHVRTCKRQHTVLIYLCPGYLSTDEHNFLILLFIYLRIFRFEFKHFHKLKNFSFATASEFAQRIDCWSCYSVWIDWATAWKQERFFPMTNSCPKLITSKGFLTVCWSGHFRTFVTTY